MRAIFLNIQAYLRASYWFIPLLMAVGALCLAPLITYIDNWLGSEWPKKATWVLMNQPAGARAVLATIAGSIITVAGVTFSLTMMAVSFAISQLGPRLIHNFMRDRLNQITLGTFIATFLYCLLVLRTVISGDDVNSNASFVPHLALFIAIVLVIINIIVLIFYIHHIAEALNVYNLLSELGSDLIRKIDSSYTMSQVDDKQLPQEKRSTQFYKKGQYVISKKNGYIRILDYKSLFSFATKHNCIIEIRHQPGDFVTTKTPLLYVSKKLDKDECSECISQFAIGDERDQNQDLYFITDAIAEIIARALSPGVNDPFTAMTAIDWLQSGIETFGNKRPKEFYSYDEKDNLRLIKYPITIELFLARVIGQIQPYVSRDRNSALHLMKMFKLIAEQNSYDKKFLDEIYKHAAQFYLLTLPHLDSSFDKKTFSQYFNIVKKHAQK